MTIKKIKNIIISIIAVASISLNNAQGEDDIRVVSWAGEVWKFESHQSLTAQWIINQLVVDPDPESVDYVLLNGVNILNPDDIVPPGAQLTLVKQAGRVYQMRDDFAVFFPLSRKLVILSQEGRPQDSDVFARLLRDLSQWSTLGDQGNLMDQCFSVSQSYGGGGETPRTYKALFNLMDIRCLTDDLTRELYDDLYGANELTIQQQRDILGHLVATEAEAKAMIKKIQYAFMRYLDV